MWGMILSFVLGLFGFAKKKNESAEAQETKKENYELTAENVALETKAEQKEASDERKKKLEEASTPKKKVNVVLERLRLRRRHFNK